MRPFVCAPVCKSRKTCHRAVSPSITPYCCLRILLCYLLPGCVTSTFWLPGGNVAKRKRVYNPYFTSEVVNQAPQQPLLPFVATPDGQLQTLIAENALLREKVSKLEKQLTSVPKEKTCTRGKPFSSLSPDRKRHRKQEVKAFLLSMSKKLPPDWLFEEVHI